MHLSLVNSTIESRQITATIYALINNSPEQIVYFGTVVHCVLISHCLQQHGDHPLHTA